ncbi:hypothetical protein E2C01_065871 [Portunus trituberculatus]|uniref:Uncharacterized protein n=1 Tax=Portunus trituberculatus TaxID=210409 RepID=A0A5B7HGQ7_PORTR|nr:hypothetical protein [Portunus trituberculatus]
MKQVLLCFVVLMLLSASPRKVLQSVWRRRRWHCFSLPADAVNGSAHRQPQVLLDPAVLQHCIEGLAKREID